LPEKTLEHWTGLYLASRFARAEQWWPTLGEDVALALRGSLTSPGKVLLLEIKVPEATPTGHSLSISTMQLQRYLGHRLPVFYVLPAPFWSGSISSGGFVPVTPASWWRRRSHPQWFGNWTYVLSASDVARHVSMSAENPVLYTVPNGAVDVSSYSPALASAVPWPIFWSDVQNCGPGGTVTWRITKDPGGELSAKSSAGQEQVNLGDLQNELLLEVGDNLVVLHIDERELRDGYLDH
jgi:hypothetical protein